jgi:hypothetical protein
MKILRKSSKALIGGIMILGGKSFNYNWYGHHATVPCGTTCASSKGVTCVKAPTKKKNTQPPQSAHEHRRRDLERR